MEHLFFDIGIILIVTALFGIVSTAINQSLIIAYIGAGILMGPSGQKLIQYLNRIFDLGIPELSIINNIGLINTLSIFGVILLLFMVGLEMNIKQLYSLKKHIGVVCLGQIVITFAAGYGLAMTFSGNRFVPFITGLALMFSSTIIGIKSLSDKKDLNSLYGKLVIGVLLAQDVVAIVVLVLLSGFQNGSGIEASDLILIGAKFISLFGFTIVWSNYVLPKLFGYIAHSNEMVFLTAIANCFLLSSIAGLLGISVEIGAFLGGLSLASLPHHLQLISKIRPLRDFFLILFFVSLGLHFDSGGMAQNWGIFALMLGFVLVIKPFLALLVILRAGFKKRTAFMGGLSLAHLSEFSLIILTIAVKQKLLPESLLSTITLVMILSILVSTHINLHAHRIFLKIGKYLHCLEHKNPHEKMHSFKQKIQGHIILCGYGGMGENILKSIQKARRKHVVVEIDPDHIQTLIRKKTPYVFGDINDPEVLDIVNIPKAELLISTMSRFEDNLLLVEHARRHNKTMIIFMESKTAEEALKLYNAGADYVIITEHIGGDHASLLLEQIYAKDIDTFFSHKTRHIAFLKQKTEA